MKVIQMKSASTAILRNLENSWQAYLEAVESTAKTNAAHREINHRSKTWNKKIASLIELKSQEITEIEQKIAAAQRAQSAIKATSIEDWQSQGGGKISETLSQLTTQLFKLRRERRELHAESGKYAIEVVRKEHKAIQARLYAEEAYSKLKQAAVAAADIPGVYAFDGIFSKTSESALRIEWGTGKDSPRSPDYGCTIVERTGAVKHLRTPRWYQPIKN